MTASPDRAGLLREPRMSGPMITETLIELRSMHDRTHDLSWDECEVCGRIRAALAATGDSERPLDVETRNYLAWAEADVPPGRSFEDWHSRGDVLLRRLAARLSSKEADHD